MHLQEQLKSIERRQAAGVGLQKLRVQWHSCALYFNSEAFVSAVPADRMLFCVGADGQTICRDRERA